MGRGLREMAERYLSWMALKHYTETTIHMRRVYLGYFMDWCEARSLSDVGEVSKSIVGQYVRHVHRHRTPQGKPLKVSSIYVRLTPLRTFFSWLSKNNYVLFNPASGEV